MWYVIQTISGQEELIKQEAMILIPEADFKIIYRIGSYKYRGKWHEERHILLPGYIFVITDDPTSVRKELRKITRFARVVRFDDELIPITPQEQEVLERLVDDDDTVAISNGIIEGDTVIVEQGPLKGLESRIKRINRHKRLAYVEFNMGTRAVEVQLGLGIIRKMINQ